MSRVFRAIVIGSTVGIVGVGILAAPVFLNATFASDGVQAATEAMTAPVEKLFPRAPAFDMARLKKFEIVTDDSVSTVPMRTVTIEKFGFGQRQTVTVVTTPTGTYSSDALVSPNVRYPGFRVYRLPEPCGCTEAADGAPVVPEASDDVGQSSFRSLPAPKTTATITWL